MSLFPVPFGFSEQGRSQDFILFLFFLGGGGINFRDLVSMAVISLSHHAMFGFIHYNCTV